jgi:ferritin
MKTSIVNMINQQINKEFYSAYLYLDFSDFLILKGLTGFAHWFRVQAMEERDHAMLLYDYLHHNNKAVVFEQIAKPDAKLEKIMDVLKEALKHEEFITASINDIYAEALKEKDFRTTQFLDWFTKEQGEEEANVQALIDKVQFLGDNMQGTYILNTELLARVYAPPTLVVG